MSVLLQPTDYTKNATRRGHDPRVVTRRCEDCVFEIETDRQTDRPTERQTRARLGQTFLESVTFLAPSASLILPISRPFALHGTGNP